MLRKCFVFTAIAAFMLVLFSGCQKDDTDEGPSKQEILTSGQWKVTAVTAKPPITIAGFPVSDLYTFLPACVRDNYYIFKSDDTAELNEGGTTCNAGDPQTQSQTWALSSDEKTITLNSNQYTILELTQTRLRVSGTFAYPGVGAIPAEVTFDK